MKECIVTEADKQTRQMKLMNDSQTQSLSDTMNDYHMMQSMQMDSIATNISNLGRIIERSAQKAVQDYASSLHGDSSDISHLDRLVCSEDGMSSPRSQSKSLAEVSYLSEPSTHVERSEKAQVKRELVDIKTKLTAETKRANELERTARTLLMTSKEVAIQRARKSGMPSRTPGKKASRVKGEETFQEKQDKANRIKLGQIGRRQCTF